MYAYCGNNPVNRVDLDGYAWKDVKNWFSKTWNKVKTWTKKVFGNESTISTTKSKKILPEPSPVVITTGSTITETKRKKNTKNPIVTHFDSSGSGNSVIATSGAKINFSSRASLDFNVGIDDVSITSMYTSGNKTKGLGVKINLMELKVGLETSSTIAWDKNTTYTTFTNMSLSAYPAVMYAMYFYGVPQYAR